MSDKPTTLQSTESNSSIATRFKSGLSKTSAGLAKGLGNLLLGQKEIDSELLKPLETALLLADLGIDATEQIMAVMIAKTRRQELNNPDTLAVALQAALMEQLQQAEKTLTTYSEHAPFVILFVGVNGSGKTTTVGKLGNHLQQQGQSVLLAAGDTFRAAATEQLQVWGERIQAPVIGQKQGADAAAVIFDSMQAAQARNINVVLADTAGRLQNKSHLMDELAKIHRVMGRFGNGAPHEVFLVLDAGVGRNGLQQVVEFQSTVNVSGLIITKLDGTAKGGAVVAATKETGLPIYYLGVGEGMGDLQPFSAKHFVNALLADIKEFA